MRTAESVMSGHPDKICDQISDLILDAYLKKDPRARVAIEVAGGHKKLFITGEVATEAEVDVIRKIRMNAEKINLPDDYGLTTAIDSQSEEIAKKVKGGGAGDQGIMVGYATNETQEMLPLPFALARRITNKLFEKGPKLDLGPDGKAQVTVDENDNIDSIVVSVQHSEDMRVQEARRRIRDEILEELFDDLSEIELLLNPKGSFTVGGFEADAGMTGRKIVADSYGPTVNVGGGAFSGKDPTKVDRSGAYMARYLAKWLVKRHNLDFAKVELAYSIGMTQPLMVNVEPDQSLAQEIKGEFDLTPQGIIELLDLQKPIYFDTARFGHFGDNFDYSWEKV